MHMNLSKVSDPIIFVFRVVGMWPKDDSNPVYWIYGILGTSIFAFLFTISMVIQLVGFTAMDDLTDTMYMTLTELALCFKILNFLLRLRSMQKLFKTIKSFELRSMVEEAHFNKRLKFIYTLLMMDFVLTNFAHLTTQIKVLASPERIIGFPAWFPFDWINDTRNYIIIFVYQLISMTVTSNIQVVIGGYPNLLFCMISTQMEILSMRLSSIGHEKTDLLMNKAVNQKISKDSQDDNTFYAVRKRETEITESLIDCFKTHREILRLTEKVERNFTFPMFIQICISGIVICSLANEAGRASNPVNQISYGAILLIMALQIFFPCYLGNQIVATSNELSINMYRSNWIYFTQKQKKFISIFLERTKRNTWIVIGNLFILNLQTFSSIMNVAYRLLAVLRSV